MARIRSFRTFVELDERNRTPNSVRARLDAILDDGTVVVVLDDRGWAGGRVEDWTTAEIEFTARTVVGPDEPLIPLGETAEQMEVGHRQALQRALADAGHDVADFDFDFDVLPHEVRIGPRLAARARG